MIDREIKFQEWMHDVDIEIGIATGLSFYDLPDQDYRAAFDDDISPKEFTSSILSEIKKGG